MVQKYRRSTRCRMHLNRTHPAGREYNDWTETKSFVLLSLQQTCSWKYLIHVWASPSNWHLSQLMVSFGQMQGRRPLHFLLVFTVTGKMWHLLSCFFFYKTLNRPRFFVLSFNFTFTAVPLCPPHLRIELHSLLSPTARLKKESQGDNQFRGVCYSGGDRSTRAAWNAPQTAWSCKSCALRERDEAVARYWNPTASLNCSSIMKRLKSLEISSRPLVSYSFSHCQEIDQLWCI